MSDTDVKAIQRRRGTSAEFDGFTSGLEGEITVNTTNNSVVVSDGNMNNYEAARADMTNVEQFDIMKRGIADNNLSNIIYEYKLDASGVIKQVRKNADQIKIQLTSAYIADKDLSNVPLQIILNKGVAKYTLLNVPFSAVSWEEDAKERLGGTELEDPSGGGLVFRNLTNAKVETFNSFPTDEIALTGGGVAYKTLSNVSELAPEIKTQMGVASIDLSNVSDDTLYNKGGHRKYLLQRDLNNIDGDNVNPEKLTSAGIAQINLSNINFNGDDELRESVLRNLGACNYNLDHVSLSVFTDKFHLMKDDGTNAVKEKVFKGVKNILVNGDFQEKHSSFSDVSFNDNELANAGDTFYSEWVAMENGSRISVSNGLARISGSWGQCIGWDSSLKTIDKLYFSCSLSSSEDIGVSLRQPSQDGWIEIATGVVSNEEGVEYDRKGCTLTLDSSKIIDKVPMMLVLTGSYSDETYVGHCQLEKECITNFMNTPANYSRVLSGERSGRACYLQIFDKLPSPKDDYYKLEPMFTSDGADATNPIYYYSLVEDGYDVAAGNKKYTKYGKPVFRFVGDNFELYNYSATQEFKLVDGDVVERISKYKNGDLFYSEETKRIYTFANDGFYLLFDTIPYQGLLYIDGRYSDHAAYLWNSAKEDFEVVSSSGSAGSALPLFAHVLSDRRLESVGWAESDSFSKQSAILYTDAYKYLKDQLHPVGSMLAGGKVGDSLNAAENATWLIEWSDNFYENTNVSLALPDDDARFAVIEFCNSKLGEYTIDNAVYEYNPDFGRSVIVDVVEDPTVPEEQRVQISLKNFVIRHELTPQVTNNVTFYNTYDGLKIVKETEDSKRAVSTMYEATGNGWFYLIHESTIVKEDGSEDLKDAYFRLPRVKGIPVSFDGDPSVFGNSYIDNVNLTRNLNVSFSTVKHKMYFYMGKPVFKREEVAVNSLFSSISQIDSKLNKSIQNVSGVEELASESIYSILKLSANTSDFVWKPKKNNDVLLINLTGILGTSEYDSETKTYPVSAYNEFTKFDFKLIVDKSNVTDHDKKTSRFYIKYYIENDVRAAGRPAITPTIGFDSYFDNESADTLTNVPVIYNDSEMISNYHVYSNIREGFDPSESLSYYRGMFVFNSTLDSISTVVTESVVFKETTQTISGSKRFTQPPEGMSIELTANTNQQTVPATNSSRQIGLYRNSTYTKGDGYTSWLQGYRGADGHTSTSLYTRRFLEGDSQEILNYVNVSIASDGTPIAYTKTPPSYVSGEEIVTAGWFNAKMQIVSVLPANPDPNVFYFIME